MSKRKQRLEKKIACKRKEAIHYYKQYESKLYLLLFCAFFFPFLFNLKHKNKLQLFQF